MHFNKVFPNLVSLAVSLISEIMRMLSRRLTCIDFGTLVTQNSQANTDREYLTQAHYKSLKKK